MALPAIAAAAARAAPKAIRLLRLVRKRRKKVAAKAKKGIEKVVTTPEYLLFAAPIAGINDILDFGNFTGIWKIVTLIIDFATAALLWVWLLLRLRDKPGIKLRIIRFIIVPIAEFIFGIGMLPCWLILVTWEYLKGRVIK